MVKKQIVSFRLAIALDDFFSWMAQQQSIQPSRPRFVQQRFHTLQILVLLLRVDLSHQAASILPPDHNLHRPLGNIFQWSKSGGINGIFFDPKIIEMGMYTTNSCEIAAALEIAKRKSNPPSETPWRNSFQTAAKELLVLFGEKVGLDTAAAPPAR